MSKDLAETAATMQLASLEGLPPQFVADFARAWRYARSTESPAQITVQIDACPDKPTRWTSTVRVEGHPERERR